MARELVALKVKIGLTEKGTAKYPNFNILPCVQASGLDWGKYIDIYGDVGWHYDRTSGHKEESIDSPLGQQWGMLIIPEIFAIEALINFPDDCTKLTELEVEDFYNNKTHALDADESIDINILQGIKLKQDLGIPLTAQQQAAIDPKDPTPGITENKEKTWAKHKELLNITIKEEIIK